MKTNAIFLCVAVVIAISRVAVAQSNQNDIVVTVQDVRIDKDTGFLVAALKVVAAEGRAIWLNTYDLESDLRLNGGSWIPQGVTRWRHIFGPADIQRLGGTNAWTRGYFYKVTNQSPDTVVAVQIRMKRSGTGDSTVMQWLEQMGANSAKTTTNLWRGVAETAEFKIKNKNASIGPVRPIAEIPSVAQVHTDREKGGREVERTPPHVPE